MWYLKYIIRILARNVNTNYMGFVECHTQAFCIGGCCRECIYPGLGSVLVGNGYPSRDPRPAFTTAPFKEGVEDLKAGMLLEGVVTNVTNLGAFVDIGVHQDGLVPISKPADKFVKDPRDVVKAGAVVKVRVVEVDLERHRSGLSMKKEASIPRPQPQGGEAAPKVPAAFPKLKR